LSGLALPRDRFADGVQPDACGGADVNRLFGGDHPMKAEAFILSKFPAQFLKHREPPPGITPGTLNSSTATRRNRITMKRKLCRPQTLALGDAGKS
jgi:hypothetical protein